jgi:putative SOS response-associated peptidase YedK
VCGRYARAKDKAALVEEFAIDEAAEQDLPADYNIAPTKSVYIVAQRPADEVRPTPRRTLAVARWGLVPSWAKDPTIGNRLINARAETAASKPAFRRAFAKRRCLVPAAGFYEWYAPQQPDTPAGHAGKPRKQPFFIHPTDGASLAMAGLYEFWRDSTQGQEQDWLMTVTVLTTTSTDALGVIHDRMPLPIPPQLWRDWLDPQASADRVAAVLAGHTAEQLAAYPVSTAVNNVRNNGPQLMQPLPESS